MNRRYDKRCTVQSRSGEKDAHGHTIPAFVDEGRRWCELQEASGRELYRAQRVEPTVSAVITLREQFAGLTPKHRIVIGERAFNIVSVLGQDDRTPQRGQMCACTEVV